MVERLIDIARRYDEINELLMSNEVISNIKKTMELSKEQATLKEAYNAYILYKKLIEGIEEAKEISKDPELGEMAKEELEILVMQKENLEKDLELILLPKDPNDGKNVIVEIRGAAGGDEANIFAGDLYRMYMRYAEKQDWKIETLNLEESEAGGYSQIEFLIKGDNVYSKLKYESGAHRVQRVPETETQGRVHTSTATVVIMPEVDEVEVEIKSDDLKVDVYRSSGAGGQHVNTTDSAVRITHIPTGVVVACQNERSQIKNRERAMQMLRAKIYEESIRRQEEATSKERKNQIGSGDRSEKIRTYNYPQNRVTDHRIGFTLKQLDRVMEGDLGDIIEALVTEDQARKLRGE
jgi:peptide chain release factor 1